MSRKKTIAITPERAGDIGFRQGRSGLGFSARFRQKEGKLRDAWEAGYYSGVAQAEKDRRGRLKQRESSMLTRINGLGEWIAEQPKIFDIPAHCYAFQRTGPDQVKVHDFYLRMNLINAAISGYGDVGGTVVSLDSRFSIAGPEHLMSLAELLERPFAPEHMQEYCHLHSDFLPRDKYYCLYTPVTLTRTLPGYYLFSTRGFLSFSFETGQGDLRGHRITISVTEEVAKLLRAIILYHHGKRDQ